MKARLKELGLTHMWKKIKSLRFRLICVHCTKCTQDQSFRRWQKINLFNISFFKRAKPTYGIEKEYSENKWINSRWNVIRGGCRDCVGDQTSARVEQYADARITSINRLDILPFQLEMRPSLTEDDLCQSLARTRRINYCSRIRQRRLIPSEEPKTHLFSGRFLISRHPAKTSSGIPFSRESN